MRGKENSTEVKKKFNPSNQSTAHRVKETIFEISPFSFCHSQFLHGKIASLSLVNVGRQWWRRELWTMAAEHESWKPEDDAKLAALFRKTDRNGKPVVNLTDLSKKYIELVHTTCFKAKKFSNFQPLYKRKVRKWNLEQTLQGARRGPAPKQCKCLALSC